MAIYEYQCPECGTFEVFQKMSEEPLSVCPQCEKKGVESPVHRILSAPAFHLKGSGWYKTDYASSSSGGSNGHRNGSAKSSAPETTASADKNSSEPKTEAKTEAKTETAASSAKETAAS